MAWASRKSWVGPVVTGAMPRVERGWAMATDMKMVVVMVVMLVLVVLVLVVVGNSGWRELDMVVARDTGAHRVGNSK